MNKIIETERLYLRKLQLSDRYALASILQDEKVMYAYKHAFDDKEVDEWLQRQLQRYEKDGFGLWALIRKSDDCMIGQCGLTWQDIKGKEVLEIGYLLQYQAWHQGYASEAAILTRDYAFHVLHVEGVYSIIEENNISSQKVAQRNGMQRIGRFIKTYYGFDMPHDIWYIENLRKRKDD